jgi:RNA polymerase primary sigma factor
VAAKKPAAKPAPKKPLAKKPAAKPAAKKPVTKKVAVKPVAKKPAAKPVAKKTTKPAAKPAAKKVIAKVPAKSAKPVKPVKPVKGAKTAKLVVKTAKELKEEARLAKALAKELAKAEKLKAKKVKEGEATLVVATDENGEPIKKTRGRKPKPVEPVDPNVDNRTDRQKARDRKAKEKALLQEFNAQKLGSEEQQELRRARLKHLIKMGKSRGYLTHGEINDVMSDEISDSDSLETLISLLSDISITVYEQAPDAETLLLNENAPSATTEEEAEEEAEAALSTVDSEFGRTTDPVRMYMREMGTVDLLTREGEIVIAKKIEAGLKEMVMALSACPVTISEILVNVKKIEEGTMEIDEFVDGLVDPNAEDIPMTAVEEEEPIEEGEEGEEGGDEDSGGGGNTASAKQLEELKQLSLVKFVVIRNQFDKMRKAHEKEGYNSPGYKKSTRSNSQ